MLNDLVNNTGNIGSSTERELYDKQCIEEIYGCINDVQCIACKNTQDIKDIKDTQDISVKSISSTSVTATSITSSGIKSDNVGTKCINVSDKATVGSLESGDIKAEDIEANSIHTGNITGLNSLTVEGDVWADKVHTDNLDVVGCIKAERLDTDKVYTEALDTNSICTSTLEASKSVYSKCFIGEDANINNACIGNLSTSSLSSDAIDVSRITSTSLSVPKVETSDGITGKGTIDTTSAVWKEIKLPLFTGTVQFYTDEWKVTITGGREFIWEDPSLEHLKFISNDGETVTVAVDWDGEVYYTYNVAKKEPVITLEDNVGHTENNDHTFIMQDSGIPRGTVFIYKDKEYTNQGIDILGKVKASNLEITCGESLECVSIANLCVGNSITSDNPIAVDICARHFCISSPESYINGNLYTKDLCYGSIYVEKCTKNPKNAVTYSDGILYSSLGVCVDDDTVYAKKSCATDFYGNLHGKATDTTCFDGRTFEKACDEILSGKAKTAGLADYAKCVCIGKYSSTCAFIPFTDNGCVFVNDDNPKVTFDKEAIKCIDINGCVCLKDDVYVEDTLHVNKVKANDVCATTVCSDRIEVETCAQFKGPVYFYDNIYQCGETWCTHAQNIYTCSDTITLREGAISAGNASIVALKYDGTNNGVIFLGTDGTLRVGDEKNCQPVLTRSEEDDITDGHVLVWDAANKCVKDSGSALVTCVYVNCVGKACKESACCSAIAMDKLCLACSYACARSICCNTISRDTLCLACAKAYSDTKASCACTYSASCIGTMSTLCTTCAKAYTDTVCCNTINRDTLCLTCSYACTNTKASCACTYAGNIGTSCKNAACAFAVTCSHAIGTACKNTAMATKANCYGNSYNCVQCSHIAKNVDLECYISTEQRYVYIGKPTGLPANKNIGCVANFWFCPTCNVLTMGDANGSAICLIGDGSCLMNGVCSRKNPSIVFATTDKQCACLQYSQYDTVHPGAGLCLATNTTNTWFDTDCVFANKFINRNGCQIGGYCATIPSPSGNTKYALLDFGAVEASVYFSVHDNEGTIVKANTVNPYGKVYAQNTYGITGFCSLGKESATNACFWLRYNGYRNIYLWGKYPIKVVSNTTTNPGCTWQSPTIPPSCDYVSTVGGQCKSAVCTYANTVAGQCKDAACTYANSVAGQCKGVACTYANSVAGQCKSAACTYANTVAGQCKGVACTYAHCAINSYKGSTVFGVARGINGQCWTKGGYWAYMTTLDGPNCRWNHVIKMDWGAAVDPWATGISLPTYSSSNAGIYYKSGCCGGHSGWKLVPDITCVQTLSGSCASSIGAACKNAACAFAAACAASVVPETSTFAKCYGNSTSCVACADKVRINTLSNNVYYKIPFTSTNGTTPTSGCLSIDAYPSYNPVSQVSCVYTECVAKTLAVPNGNGSFRLGSYCIYIG